MARGEENGKGRSERRRWGERGEKTPRRRKEKI